MFPQLECAYISRFIHAGPVRPSTAIRVGVMNMRDICQRFKSFVAVHLIVLASPVGHCKYSAGTVNKMIEKLMIL